MLIVVSKIDDKINHEWVLQFPNILFYNKSNLNVICNNIRIPPICSHYHSLFHYIYNNYDNLNDNIIFISLQHTLFYDNMDVPDKEFIDNIWYYINNETENFDFKYISRYKSIIHNNEIFNTFHEDEDTKHINYTEIFNMYKNIYIKLFGIFEEISIEFCEGLNILLSKKSILSKPKSYYYDIIQFCENEIIQISENNNYYFFEDLFFEHLIGKIFTGNVTNINETYSIDYTKYPYFVEIEPPIIDEIEPPIIDKFIQLNIDDEIEPPIIDEEIEPQIIDEDDNFDMNDPFNSKEICFRPPKNYCDFCNVIESVVKPKLIVYSFCSENCLNQYQNSVEKKNN